MTKRSAIYAAVTCVIVSLAVWAAISVSKTYTLQIGPGPLGFDVSQPITNATVGIPWSYTFKAVGGSPPYRFGTPGTVLPAGFVLDAATGTVTANPTVKGGPYSWGVIVTDSVGATSSVGFDSCYPIFVYDPITISTSSIQGGYPGQPYQAQLTATGGAPVYAWSVSNGQLPLGLGLGAQTGLLSGTIDLSANTSTQPINYIFTVKVQSSTPYPLCSLPVSLQHRLQHNRSLLKAANKGPDAQITSN